ncbi:MAG TPA: class I SAM-dependent methyltransferase [Pyrinomonadaceae bacterium]|nr:class I SAM-dependent methyltransferase [Pyrinomonadaceae bacterium]
MEESDIKDFWNRHPCGDTQVAELDPGDYESFFARYDKFRYTEEAYILQCLDQIPFAGKRVLEIGLGQGADAEQIIRRGGRWSGLDLTPESVARVKKRFALRDISYDAVKQGTALQIPFDTASFDLVFSFGVLHHVPDVTKAQQEIRRVLKPSGELVVMLYAKWSMNYLLSISILRRLGLLALYAANRNPSGIYGQHLANARTAGLWRYLQMSNFIHRNTDGPLNPYSKVYDLAAVRRDFPDFQIIGAYKRFMHAPPLPVRWLPLERLFGWHLWVHLKPA